MYIILHGLLARSFKEKFYAPDSIDEKLIVDFVNCNQKNFKSFLKKKACEGKYYEIIKSSGNFHFVPVLSGNLGAVIAATMQTFSSFALGALTNIAIGGIIQLISPSEEQSYNPAESSVVLQSTRFQGLLNTESQGEKVPIGYGRLKIGSKIVNQYTMNINVQDEEAWIQDQYATPLYATEQEYLNATIYEN